MFLVRGIWQAVVAILNPVHPWENVARRRAPVTHAIAVNATQVMIMASIIYGIAGLLERGF